MVKGLEPLALHDRKCAYWVSLLLGYGGSIVGTLLVRGVAQDRIWGAMGMEALAGLMGIAGWKLWEDQQRDTYILLVELAGAVIGTGVTLRLGW